MSTARRPSWSHFAPLEEAFLLELTDPPGPSGNRLLDALPRAEYERLLPHMKPVSLAFKHILYDLAVPIPYVYFPTSSAVSLLIVMDDGMSVEVTMMGNEGMVGLPVFLGVEATHGRAIVQIAGAALRMPATAFRREVTTGSPLHGLLHRYTEALLVSIAQTAACNRLHSIDERCSCQLLRAHDHTRADTFPLTQESLARMLGVRRATVTVAAGLLQRAGLIRYRRGVITILDRPRLEERSCECYRVVRVEYDRALD